jgi:O-antigen/teichoic acid export membrane protein
VKLSLREPLRGVRRAGMRLYRFTGGTSRGRHRRSSRGGLRQRLSILSSFGASQLLVFVTSLARIPLAIEALGTRGYGVLLAVASLLPWMALVVSSLTNLTRVEISECIGTGDADAARVTLASLRRSGRKMSFAVVAIGGVLAGALPWSSILRSGAAASPSALRISIAIAAVAMALSTSGAISLGVMHACRQVAIAQLLPGVGALVSLGATVVAFAAHLSLVPFVAATSLATCSPYWLAILLGRRSARALKRGEFASAGQVPATLASGRLGRTINARTLVIMTGAAAPPLFSTGLDPIVLSLSRGPIAVASYGLATRLGLIVTLLPSGLYPLLWANFARLRAAGDIARLRGEYWRELRIIGGGTAVLATAFALIGPRVATAIGGGKVAVPELLYSSISVLGVIAAVQTVTLPVLAGRKTAPWTATLVYGQVIPNEALSYVLSKHVGAAGPIIASIVAGIAFLCACWWLVKRDPDRLVEVRVPHN